ncbi:MAG: DegT/DnrJ/EryC1/StrS family aminotransferase [bacterium]
MGYKVPFVNYSLQYKKIKKRIDKTMADVLNRGDLILRKDTEEFEKKLADFIGVKYAVGLNSGTDALFFSLLACGIKKGDEVITVSHTFVASIATIVQAGGKPILVDVGNDYVMDTGKLEKVIGPKTKFIIPVHLNGRMVDMEKVMAIAKKYNLIVIEDAAQSIGAKYKMKKLGWRVGGSIGLTGCFSFYPAKILGCFGDGGAITTNNQDIAQKVRLLRDHGQETKTNIVCYGWNSRLDNLQAAVLNVKLAYLSDWIKRRREIAKIYSHMLTGIKEIKLPPEIDSDPNYFDVFQNYVICAERRNELYNYLKENGVETLIKDRVANHCQPGLNLSRFKLPVSEHLANEVISLPMYPELTNQQVGYVVKCIVGFYRHRRV